MEGALRAGSPPYAMTAAVPPRGPGPRLRIWLFGAIRAEAADGHDLLPRTRKARAVLAVLALAAPRPVLRAELSSLLWSRRQAEQARGSLRQAVHELRQSLGEHGDMLLAERSHVVLRDAGLWVDTAAFTGNWDATRGSLDLFLPHLVEDLTGIDPAFDRWRGEQAARLTDVARRYAEGILRQPTDPAGTIAAAEALLRVERTHEAGWRALIQGRAALGDRAGALAAYAQCRATLASYLQLRPSAETEALVARLRPEPPRVSATVIAQPPPPPVRRNLRVAVMPFRAPGRHGDDGLAVGLAEEITAALARFRWLSCVAAASLVSMAYEIPADTPALQRLDLDFLLGGTVQRSGNRVRIITRLTDMHRGGEVVWARRFDREVVDILSLQDEIAAETVAQIDPELLLRQSERAAAREYSDPEAHELLLRAIPAVYRLTNKGYRRAGAMLETSLTLDPSSAAAHAWFAYWHLFLVGQGWAPDPGAATLRAADLAERAVALDPEDARALTLAGHVRGFLGKQAAEACALHDRAIALNPNLAMAWCFSGLAHSYLGEHEEAIRRIEQARTLSPYDPHRFFFDTALIMPHLLLGDYPRAVESGQRAIALNPGFSSAYKGCIAALGHLGRNDEAAELRTKLLALEPRFTVRDAADRSPMRRGEDLERYAEGLRRAGLPQDE